MEEKRYRSGKKQMKKSLKLLLGTAGAAGLTSVSLYAAADLLHTFVMDNKKRFPLKFKENSPLVPVEVGKMMPALRAGQEWLDRQELQTHTIVNRRGQRLTGYYIPPKGDSNVIIFFCHGFKGNGKSDICFFGERYMEDFGYGIFSVDHTGSGKSEGRYSGFCYLEAQDGVEWLHYLNAVLPGRQFILHGGSMGGATVLCMTGEPDLLGNVKFAVGDCGFTSAWDEFTYELRHAHAPVHPIIDLFNSINIKKAGYDLRKASAIDAVRRSHTPTLIIHGERDTFVPTYMAQELYDACAAEKELVIVKDATHELSAVYDPALYYGKIHEFADRYLDHT